MDPVVKACFCSCIISLLQNNANSVEKHPTSLISEPFTLPEVTAASFTFYVY